MSAENKLDESIKQLRSFQEKMKEASTKTKDVKEGTATPEEEQQEPAYVLYNHIAETSISILQLPTFVEGFKTIADKVGGDVAQKFAEMMVIAMTHSAHNAIAFYDELLKAELTRQFDHYGKSLNTAIGTVNGQSGALEVFKERISRIEKRLQIEDLLNDPGQPVE